MARFFPIGIQTFSEIRERNAIYIDKTHKIYELANDGKVYFLSRPRRFGKSLLISTLESYFKGEKELFTGLAIEKLEQNWTKYPVFRIDMSGAKYLDLDSLNERIDIILSRYEEIYGRQDANQRPSSRLSNLIERAYKQTGQKVVVLIDEYDAPLLDTLVDDETFKLMRNTMRDFFSPLKACDAMLRFVFLTGITKFSQLSIFSELNNLNNISMDDAYCDICGISSTELQAQMQPELQEMAHKMEISVDELLLKMKKKYDGYHFSPRSADIFNPFSVLNALNKKELGSYWFSSGTPTFLVEKIQKSALNPTDFDEGFETTIDTFDVPTESTSSPIPVLFQSGYLTIKGYNPNSFSAYTLGYPNEEVRDGFLKCLIARYSRLEPQQYNSFINKLINNFKANSLDTFFAELRAFMSSIPYDAEEQNELHYKTIIYLVFRIASPYLVRCEEKSAAGRSDVVVETADSVYVMEFKLDGSVDDALKQIGEKGYLLPYSANGKTLYKIGVNFDTKTRTIGEWKVVTN